MMGGMRSIVLIGHNLRSCHNVGSLLRTAEGLGVEAVWLTGYTPYPIAPDDQRFPHVRLKIDKQITKTALGAQQTVNWSYRQDVSAVIAMLKQDNYVIAAIEQAPQAIQLPHYSPPQKIALVVGREVEGIEPEVLAQCDTALEIPMYGQKESFNVVQAAAMVLYHCRFFAVSLAK